MGCLLCPAASWRTKLGIAVAWSAPRRLPKGMQLAYQGAMRGFAAVASMILAEIC
jgi:hypothetical protein